MANNQEILKLIKRASNEDRPALDLSSKELQHFPPEIWKLTNLTSLNLNNNQLTALSPDIARLTHLTTLELGENQLTAIPPEISKLTKLTSLDLRENKLTRLPPEITSLKNLLKLNLALNQLESLPAEFARLTNLADLNLGANNLTSLPAGFTTLAKLTFLNLSGNRLKSLPPNFTKLTNLTHLRLYKSELLSVPPEVTKLTNLRSLDLGGNPLTSLPTAISRLTNLTTLDLSGSELTRFPLAITKLINLTTLSLIGNKLTSLPPDIAKLINLTALYLSYNHLTSVPPELERLPKLATLDLQNNRLPISPESLAEPSNVKAILAAIAGLVTGERLNEAKMLVVGDGKVGKSSVVERLLYGTFDPQKQTTVGVEINDEMKVVQSNVKGEGEPVKLNIWDFGGQEIQHSTHQFFLTTRSLYLLVVDARKGDQLNNTEYWLKLIQSFGGDSPIIVVINQIDQLKGQRPLNLDRKALQDKYHICAFVETSCETGEGIPELKTTIIREIEQLKHVRDVWPREWIAIKQRLKGMQADYLSVEQYLDICAEEKLNDEELQQSLLDILHVLGTVIRFPGDTQVLNPRWVTQGVYALLTSNKLVKSQGQFDLEHVGEILAGMPDGKKHYPSHTHERLIRVMRHFELCFEFTDRPGHYLIPRHLHDNEPDIPWKDDDALKFQYHYETLPDSVISRFIVRMNQFITQRHYWKNGVFLESDGGNKNLAKIKADMVDRKIFISVTGKEQTRRAFLAIIRSAFDEINSTLKIEIGQMIPMPGFPQVLVSYEDLLAYEESNEPEIFIPELRTRFPVRELLDGVEELSIRIKRRERILNGKRFPQPLDALSDLRKQIVKSMSDDEIGTLAFDLDIDYENLKGDTKEAKARELVLYCDRTGKLSDLIELCRALRPNLTWNIP